MGWISVGEASVAIDDRTLRHLHLAMSAALITGEAFHLSWREEGIGRTSVWISRSSKVKVRYSGPPPTDLNARWVMALRLAASTPAGITVIDESEIPVGFANTQRHVTALRDHSGQWGPLASPK